MNLVFRYGSGRSLELSLAEGALVAACGEPASVPVDDVATALETTLDQPLDYPPLCQAITPGDRVVLAVERGVPQADVLVAATIGYLVRHGIAPDGITVLQPPAEIGTEPQDLRQRLPDQWRQHVSLVTHEPDNAGHLAYLAMSHENEAILLNRALTDADVVLPIGVLCPENTPGYFGPHGVIYPTFANRKAQQRFRSPNVMHVHGKRSIKLHGEVEEIAWLLGVTFGVQVVPGSGDSILRILAGECSAVGRQGRASYDQAWENSTPGRASLVVGAISGGPGQQTWSNLGRALAAASALVEEGGAVALCCDLAASPGPGVKGLSEVESPSEVLDLIRKVRPDDIFTALQIARSLEQSRLYLLSGLDSTLVEQLNMIVIEGPEQVLRLIERHPSCILLANAQQAIVTVESES